MKSGEYCIYFINTVKLRKSLQQFNQVIIIMEENMAVIREPKTFYFDFDLSKDVDKI